MTAAGSSTCRHGLGTFTIALCVRRLQPENQDPRPCPPLIQGPNLLFTAVRHPAASGCKVASIATMHDGHSALLSDPACREVVQLGPGIHQTVRHYQSNNDQEENGHGCCRHAGKHCRAET